MNPAWISFAGDDPSLKDDGGLFIRLSSPGTRNSVISLLPAIPNSKGLQFDLPQDKYILKDGPKNTDKEVAEGANSKWSDTINNQKKVIDNTTLSSSESLSNGNSTMITNSGKYVVLMHLIHQIRSSEASKNDRTVIVSNFIDVLNDVANFILFYNFSFIFFFT